MSKKIAANTPTTKTNGDSVDLAEMARRYFRAHATGARHYQRANILLRKMIVAGLRPGQEIKLSEFDTVILKDKLEDDIQFFHGSYARRFELERK